MAYEDDIAAAAAEADEQRHRIVDTRPGRDGETYIPDTTNARQDPSPRPVPERDSSGQPWRITADGRHIGTHNGDDYCLEWLPIPERREPVATKPAEPQPAADEPSPAGRERERDEKAGSRHADRPCIVIGGDQADTDFDGAPGASSAAAEPAAGPWFTAAGTAVPALAGPDVSDAEAEA